MERSLNHQIIRYGFILVLVTIVLYGMVSLSFQLINPDSSTPIAKKRGFSREYVLAEVSSALDQFDLELPDSPEVKINLKEREIASLEILRALQEKDIEVYRLVETEHISLHIYDQKEKILLLHFHSSAKDLSNKRLSLQSFISKKNIAIVIAGVGSRDIKSLTSCKQPLNFAIVPHQPFSLRTAQQAAHHWHEILIDQRERTTAWDSLPFYSGVLVERASSPPSSHIDVLSLGSQKIVEIPSAESLDFIRLNTAWEAAVLKAQEQDSAVILIDIQKRDISGLLTWLEDLPEGTSLALVSEI
jgi:hypothetical protein